MIQRRDANHRHVMKIVSVTNAFKKDSAVLAKRAYDGMSTEVRAVLDEGIAQAERGETFPAADVFGRLAQRFGFSNA